VETAHPYYQITAPGANGLDVHIASVAHDAGNLDAKAQMANARLIAASPQLVQVLADIATATNEGTTRRMAVEALRATGWTQETAE
jgi:hypothetical protein